MAKQITVVTGFGYYTDSSDRVIGKPILQPGSYYIPDSLNYIELESQELLDLVSVDTADLMKESADRAAIAAKIEQIAIDALKAAGHVFGSTKYKEK